MTDDACLTDDEIAELVEGRLGASRMAVVERHLSSCITCPQLVAAVARAVEPPAQQSPAATAKPTPSNSPTPLSPGVPSSGPQPLRAGARVGRYEVLELLGVGGMGSVYAARDPSLDRRVALKLVRHGRGGPDLEARLLREAKSMARLSHPEVISVFDVGMHGDQLFIAMELVEGGTLREWLVATRREWREVLDIFLRAGRGLARAHAAGIIHRDFKPDNVLVGTDGRVRVTDFGLARVGADLDSKDGTDAHDSSDSGDSDAIPEETQLTKTGLLVGTPAYMAPENVMGTPADARSDVYCFCVALYEGLYGERPFRAASARELHARKRAMTIRPAPPKSDVPPRLRRALLIGLEAEPSRRYASMEALMAALTGAAHPSRVRLYAGLAALGALVTAGVVVAIPMVRAARKSTSDAGISGSASTSPSGAGPSCRPSVCSKEHGGAAYTCRADGSCAPVASAECTVHHEPGDLLADDTVWIGALFPTQGDNGALYGNMNVQGTELARSELAKATSALVGPDAARHVRRLALVSCDDTDDPMRVAKHLVEDVGVPAILGFASGQEVVDVAGSYLVQRHVLTVASLSSSPLVTRIPQPADLPRLVWRTTFSLDLTAVATAAILHDVLGPRVTSAEPLQPPRQLRVAVAHGKSASGVSFADKLSRSLVLNGKPALDNGDAWTELEFPPVPTPADLKVVVDAATLARPSLLVLVGGPAATVPIVEQVEARWPKGAQRPTYVVSSDDLELFREFLGRDADRRRRLFAVQSLSSSTTNARFVIRYNAANAKSVSRMINPGPSYDAFYLLAYAVYALGDRPVDGLALSRSFARLMPPGPLVEVGPTPVFDAITRLGGGGGLDLVGTQSALDLDPVTGEGPSDFELLCANVDGAGAATGETIESGVIYRAAEGRIEGTLHCP